MLLITGVTGHSGKHFLQELIDNKYEGKIRCIVRNTSDTSLLDNCGLDIEKVIGDLNDQVLLDKVMNEVDTIIHIGSIFYSSNVMEAAIKNNVKRAILVHTTGIYSKFKSASEEYQQIESDIDILLEKSGLGMGLIYLRPTMIYGYINDRNMIVFIKMVDKLRLFPIINYGKNLLQPVNGRDLGKAYYQILMHKEIVNGDYVLSGEKPISMVEMLSLISSILNKKTRFISVPLNLGVFMARSLKAITFGKIDFVERVQRMGEDRNFSHKKAREDFNYSPIPFKEGLKLEIDEYLSNLR